MKTNYFEELQKYAHIFQDTGFMCNYECFMMDFDENVYLPFDDRTINYLFPVLKGTKYANKNTITPDIAKALGDLSLIPEPSENEYNKKIKHVLSLNLNKDLFKEHSLYLMKEHLKLFSSYSEPAKKLLKKLESLDE